LAATLRSLDRSTVAVDEVVVSDDSTNWRSKAMVARDFPRVRFIEGPRRGLCANRNVAVEAARGSHVLFLDDDARLGKTFLASALSQLELSPLDERSRMIVTGIEIKNGTLMFAKKQDFLGYERRTYQPGDLLRSIAINCTLFPIDALRRIPFDERLIHGCGEVDFATRATAVGYRIVLAPRARSERSPAEHDWDYYWPFLDASRLYVTFKRYRYTDGRPFAAACYAIVSPIHLSLHRLRRHGIRSVPGTVRALATAWGYVVQDAAERRTQRSGGRAAKDIVAHEMKFRHVDYKLP
jgi:GT2 family glycosyltransferase